METEASTETTSWHSEDNAEFVTTKGWEDPNAVIGSYIELEKSMGGRVKLPTEDTPVEEVSAFYKKLGMPETIADYTKPEMQEGDVFNEDFFNLMAAASHEVGVSDKQLSAQMGKYMVAQRAQIEANKVAAEQEAQAAEQELEKKWAGNYDKNQESIRRLLHNPDVVREDMREPLFNLLKEKGLDTNPILREALLLPLAQKVMGDTLITGDPVVNDNDYKPQYANSPEMYRNGDGEEDQKARDWIEKNTKFKY